MKLFISLLFGILLYQHVVADENVALFAKGSQSSLKYDAKTGVVTDGDVKSDNWKKCTYTYSSGNHWMVLDLGGEASIKKVVVHTLMGKGAWLNGYKVSIGNEWRPCKISTLSSMSQCDVAISGVTDSDTNVTLTCSRTGRYLALYRTDPSPNNLIVCEIEAFGRLKPKIENTDYTNRCELTATSENLAFNVTGFQSSVYYDKAESYGTDGLYSDNWKKCSYSSKSGKHWYVVDLGKFYNINLVRLWLIPLEASAQMKDYEIAIGDRYRPCQLNLIDEYPSCGSPLDPNSVDKVYERRCNLEGRYVAIRRKGGPVNEYFGFCEIEVFGKLMTLQPVRPEYEDKCEVTATEVNRAFKKPSKTSSVQWGDVAAQGNDGMTKGGIVRYDSCIYTAAERRSFYVINFLRRYRVKFIRIWNRNDGYKGGKNGNITVHIGNSYLPCEGQQLRGYKKCGVTHDQLNQFTEIRCDDLEGQYIIVKKDSETDPLIICELEVFGDLVSDNIYEKEPVVKDEPYDLTAVSKSPVRDALLEGVESIDVEQFSTVLRKTDANVESILWSHDDKELFMLATKVGKGKFIATGSQAFTDQILTVTQNVRFWKNVKKWLTGDENAKTLRIQQVDKAEKGDILVFNGWENFSKESADETLRLLKKGRNPVIFGLRGYFYTDQDLDTLDFNPLLKAAHIQATKSIISYSPLTLYPKKYANDVSSIEIRDILDITMNSINALKDFGRSHFQQLRSIDSEYAKSINLSQKIKQILRKYRNVIDWHCPCNDAPLKDPFFKELVYSYNMLMIHNSLADSGIKAPAVHLFPGDYETRPTLISRKLNLKGGIAHEAHASGFYLPAGETVKFTEISTVNSTLKDWKIAIGCQTDNITKRPEWYRFPLQYTSASLTEMQLYSPFGGVVWIQNSINNAEITLTISNVVETPFFNLRNPKNVADWNRRRNAPGLWAEISGDSMTLCLDSSKIRAFKSDYVEDLMVNIWDKLAKMDHNFRGTNWRTYARQRTVTDIQTSVGWGHSGYPISTHLPWFKNIWNSTRIRLQGSWGMCHEFGHNMQQRMWGWSGTGEVTNNLFCLYNYHELWKLDYFKFAFTESKIAEWKKYLQSGAKFVKGWTESPWTALAIYSQMADHFGFSLYKSTFRKYPALKSLPKTDPERKDRFAELLSETAELNVAPIFEFWGIEVTAEMQTKLKEKYDCFLPDDRYTKLAPERAEKIRSKYSNCDAKGHMIADEWPLETLPMRPNDLFELQ